MKMISMNKNKGIGIILIVVLLFSLMIMSVFASTEVVPAGDLPSNGDLGAASITTTNIPARDGTPARTAISATYQLRTAVDDDAVSAARLRVTQAETRVSDLSSTATDDERATAGAAVEEARRALQTLSNPQPLGSLTREIGGLSGTFTTRGTNPQTLTIKVSPSIIGRDIQILGTDGQVLSDTDLRNLGYSNQDVARIRELVNDAVANDGTDASRYEDKTDEYPPLIVQRNNAILSQYMSKTKGRLTQIFSSYLDAWLGPFTMGVPAAMCGDSLYYEDETSSAESNKGVIFGSAMQPLDNRKSNYKSSMKKALLEDIKTVIIEGEKTELLPTMYRYAVTLKMIGDSSEKWKLYLYNSCTGEDSFTDAEESEGKLGWYEYGQISFQQFFGTHYAGTRGNDMIFDCSLGENCRFDQACIEFEGKGVHCVTLAHGGGFSTTGETGSTSC